MKKKRKIAEGSVKLIALASFLGCKSREIKQMPASCFGLDKSVYAHKGAEYLVATDGEADQAVMEYINDSAWAFRAEFLANYCDLPVKVFETLQPQCEKSNDTVLDLINRAGDILSFTQDAVAADGREHFLAAYDGEENEVDLDIFDDLIYIYRIN